MWTDDGIFIQGESKAQAIKSDHLIYENSEQFEFTINSQDVCKLITFQKLFDSAGVKTVEQGYEIHSDNSYYSIWDTNFVHNTYSKKEVFNYAASEYNPLRGKVVLSGRNKEGEAFTQTTTVNELPDGAREELIQHEHNKDSAKWGD